MTLNILSYGGGVNSSALFFWLLEKNKPLDLVIFSDTGEETPQTYDAVSRMNKECIKRGIVFKTVRSHLGNMYNYYLKNKTVPSVMRRDCTTKFKIRPIRKYLRENYGKKEDFNMYIGITSEEWKRVKNSDVKYIKNIFPFVDHGINRTENIKILDQNNFKAIKSGCKGCIYLKKKDWFKMALDDPDEFDRWMNLDLNNMRYPDITLSPMFPLIKIKKAAKGQTTLPIINDPEYSCDVAGGCFL